MSAAAEPPSRIATLDILRGVAVMGILAMNIVAFAMPEPAYWNPAAYGGDQGADLAAWFAAFVLVDGKMRGLFSLLFGASMLLVIQRAEAAGISPAAAHYWRNLWLAAFGALHFFFIWWGDILLHYAIIALLAYPLHRASDKALRYWIGGLLLFSMVQMIMMSAGFLAASAAASAPGAGADAVAQWRTMSTLFGPMPQADLWADLALHRGPYGELVAHRLTEGWSGPLTFLLFGGFETLALMLLGMLGLRSGFLTGQWERQRYRRVSVRGLLIGATGFSAIGTVIYASGFDTATIVAGALGASTPFRLLMVIGYAALIILLIRPPGALAARIAAAGRAAFSNYLGTSILMTGLFYGWGLGLYGRVGRAELYLFVLGAWALMLLWSKPWLERFRYGPLEWLWRSLARGRAEPIRRLLPAA